MSKQGRINKEVDREFRKSVRAFTLDLEEFNRKTNVDMHHILQKATVELLKGAVLKTPVDKGVAQGSWVIGVSKPHDSYISKGGETPQAIMDKGNKTRWPKSYRPMFVSNYVPYIRHLEHGTATRRPVGMVSRTIVEVQRALKDEMRKIKKKK